MSRENRKELMLASDNWIRFTKDSLTQARNRIPADDPTTTLRDSARQHIAEAWTLLDRVANRGAVTKDLQDLIVALARACEVLSYGSVKPKHDRYVKGSVTSS